MDYKNLVFKENPREKAGIFSAATFKWTLDLLLETRRQKSVLTGKEESECWKPIKKDACEYLASKLNTEWQKEVKKKGGKSSLSLVFFRTFFSELFWITGLQLTTQILKLAMPIFIGQMLANLGDVKDAMLPTICLVTVLFLQSITTRHRMNMSLHLGIKMQSAATNIIYAKCLRLRTKNLEKATPGYVLNLVSNDVCKLARSMEVFTSMPTAPVTFIIATCALYQIIGFSAVVGVLTLFVTFSAGYIVTRLILMFVAKALKQTDKRIKLMNELIHGVRVIKMYAWEKPFITMVTNIRRKELSFVCKNYYIRSIFTLLNTLFSRIYLLTVLTAYVLMGNYVTTSAVFVTYSFGIIMTYDTVVPIFRAFIECADMMSSILRIQDFLLSEEKEYEHLPKCDYPNSAVTLRNVTTTWSPAIPPTLKGISLNVMKGERIGIFGKIGVGKSSLLQTLLGELSVLEGEVKANGEFSYASQDPWIFASSAKQNILFGQTYDSFKYATVTKACCLHYDFQKLPQGDQTLVGEKGVALSGGQKARINLARCIYREADIYLLDDPLSAVDTKVGKMIFEGCIMDYLEDKTVILITHQIQYMHLMNKIVLMEDGQITFQGTPAELYTVGIDYKEITRNEMLTNETNEDESQVFSNDMNNITETTNDSKGYDEVIEQINQCRMRSESILTCSEAADDVNFATSTTVLQKSELEKTNTSFWNYLTYANTKCFVSFVVLYFITSQLFLTAIEIFLAEWIYEDQRFFYHILSIHPSVNSTVEQAENDTIHRLNNRYLQMFFALVFGAAVFAFIRAPLSAVTTLAVSKKLHSTMFQHVLSTPLAFFIDNPSGHILNRFSVDLGDVDFVLPYISALAIQTLLEVCSTFVLTLLANVFYIVPIIILILLVYLVYKFYISAFNNLRRAEGIARGPVYSYLNSSLQGLMTIRVTSINHLLQHEFSQHLDAYVAARYLVLQSSSGFAFVADLLNNIFFATVVFAFVILSIGGTAIAGVIITNLLRINAIMSFTLRLVVEIWMQLISFERALQYTTLESETQPSIEEASNVVGSNWPSKGRIDFANVYLYYKIDQSPVLKNINVTIHPMEKIGIVGRTGAGKSSLTNALFRLALIKGHIRIDDVDTGTLRLDTLRMRLSIVPQDPVLFSGTLRENLDPFTEYPDYALINSLKQVGLYDRLTTNVVLDLKVMEGGNNFSIGERQLICLARAILRKNKILVMDEATANMDNKTDKLIQEVVSKLFKRCTVLTVAHRLHTVIDCDKIMVMDGGEIAEYGPPYELLVTEGSRLRRLVEQTGTSTTDFLMKKAEKAYRSRNVELKVPSEHH